MLRRQEEQVVIECRLLCRFTPRNEAVLLLIKHTIIEHKGRERAAVSSVDSSSPLSFFL